MNMEDIKILPNNVIEQNKVLINDNKEIKKKLMGVIDINNKLVESNLKLKNMYDFNKKLINDSMNMQKEIVNLYD